MKDYVTELIGGNRAAVAMAAEEFLEIHRLLDTVKVGRRLFGEPLTAAQRVEMLVLAYRDTLNEDDRTARR